MREKQNGRAMGSHAMGSVLPQLTNRWLKVNAVETREEAYSAAQVFGGAMLNGVAVEAEKSLPAGAPHPLWNEPRNLISTELMRRNQNESNLVYRPALVHGAEEVLSLALSAEHPVLIDRTEISLQEGQVATVVLDCQSADSAKCLRNGSVAIELAADAKLTLVIINRFNEETVSNLAIAFANADGAELEIAHIEMGAGVSNYHLAGDLDGAESMVDERVAYLARGNEKLDLFYDVRFRGVLSKGEIKADGALFDAAHKNFRGTLDFFRGAHGAVGDEEETTMLLSDSCKSIAVPLLLCQEDAVEGNHAASAGRLDENELFYLMSRGFARKQAEHLIIRSRMTPTIDRIPSASLRAMVEELMEKQMEGGRA